MRSFPIDFVRQVIEQTLLEEKIKEPNKYFGGDSQVKLFSFYEQLQKDDEVNRYVEIYRDLTEQQNRTGLIMNGTIIAPENPTITNVNQCLIIPMSFTCNFRVKLKDRDMALDTINNLIGVLKGRKQDVAEFYDGRLFKVGTMGNRINGTPDIENGDFIGWQNSPNQTVNTAFIKSLITSITSKGFNNNISENKGYCYLAVIGGHDYYLKTVVRQKGEVDLEDVYIEDIHYDGMEIRTVNGYVHFQSVDTFSYVPSINDFVANIVVEDENHYETKQVVCTVRDEEDLSLDSDGHIVGTAYFEFELIESEWDFPTISCSVDDLYSQPQVDDYKVLEDDGHTTDVIFCPSDQNFYRYKLSMSFDSIRCDEPRTLNAEEYCVISFGGSATLVSKEVALGNDLVKVAAKRTKIKANPDITISDNNWWLEPLELPSGNSADTQVNQLLSNKFITNTHTDSLTIALQYTFILDKSIGIIKNWFDYARYGKQADGTNIAYTNGITPNMIYEITEIWSSWGEVEVNTFKAKIVESIDIENTESDTLTITIPFQVQGDNN